MATDLLGAHGIVSVPVGYCRPAAGYGDPLGARVTILVDATTALDIDAPHRATARHAVALLRRAGHRDARLAPPALRAPAPTCPVPRDLVEKPIGLDATAPSTLDDWETARTHLPNADCLVGQHAVLAWGDGHTQLVATVLSCQPVDAHSDGLELRLGDHTRATLRLPLHRNLATPGLLTWPLHPRVAQDLVACGAFATADHARQRVDDATRVADASRPPTDATDVATLLFRNPPRHCRTCARDLTGTPHHHTLCNDCHRKTRHARGCRDCGQPSNGHPRCLDCWKRLQGL